MTILQKTTSAATGSAAREGGTPPWRPQMNAFHCTDHLTVCVDLAGTDAESIEVTVGTMELIVRGHRRSIEPTQEHPRRVLALEIEHGPFERVFALPEPVEATQVEAEPRAGLLWIRLPLSRRAPAGAAA